jgi:ABC-2 type transport system ATP-binding protein
MNPVLEINGLSKRYGSIQAVNNLNLSIKPGSVFGLLGPNGSGKTTTLGMLLGVVKPQNGSFKWFGEQPSSDIRKRIGAILERPIFYPQMSAVENLKVVCQIKNVDYKEIDRVLKWVNLYERRNHAFKGYSLGMKQRLSIASAMLCNPEVLILDEPTNGLDPQGINEIREIIINIAKSGKTIILASHLLDEVQKVCNEFAILSSGNLIYTGNVEADLNDDAYIEIASENLDSLKSAISEIHGISEFIEDSGKISFKAPTGLDLKNLNRELAEKNIWLSHLSIKKKSLEKRFLEVLKQND